MLTYLLRRLLMIIPTLFGITLVVFVIINLAPGSPIEQQLQAIRFGGAMGEAGDSGGGVAGQGDTGVSSEVIEALKAQYGFDKPLLTRYGIWLKNLSTLDFGNSFSYEDPVIDVIISKFPVSLQFGLTSFILTYIVCILLGIYMARKDGTWIDRGLGLVLFIAYSIPPFMLGILLIVFLSGGSFLSLFPIGGLHSDFYYELNFFERVLDRLHHFVLPLICYMIGSFTTLTLLMKNSLLDELKKDYIRTARSKGLSDKSVVFKHSLRNALIPIATGIGSFLTVFFAGSLFLETIFQLDGIGLLGYNAVLARDYNVLMGLVFIQSLLLLIGNIVTDFVYVLIDPRIDYK